MTFIVLGLRRENREQGHGFSLKMFFKVVNGSLLLLFYLWHSSFLSWPCVAADKFMLFSTSHVKWSDEERERLEQ